MHMRLFVNDIKLFTYEKVMHSSFHLDHVTWMTPMCHDYVSKQWSHTVYLFEQSLRAKAENRQCPAVLILTMFSKFGYLPKEIRIKIWTYTVTPRIVPIRCRLIRSYEKLGSEMKNFSLTSNTFRYVKRHVEKDLEYTNQSPALLIPSQVFCIINPWTQFISPGLSSALQSVRLSLEYL